MTHGAITEPSVSYHRVTHDRKGREGNRKGSRSPIHRLYRWADPTRRQWMATDVAEIGGGH